MENNQKINKILRDNADNIILLLGATAESLHGATILPSITPSEKLGIGISNVGEYIYPNWYRELESNDKRILVIDQIDKIDTSAQEKFLEIIKYKSISSTHLPKGTQIIITAKSINRKLISDKIISHSIIFEI